MTEHDFPASKAAAEATVSAAMPAERLVARRYRLLDLLGSGASKQVYAAHDELLDRRVAVAVIDTADVPPTVGPRLLREVRTTARLGDHPNIVTVFDVEREDTRAYVVSCLVDGGSLADRLKRCRAGRLPIEEAVTIAAQVAEALAHAHRQNVIHRDVKPGNVLLTADGTAQLADFGLALLREGSRITAPNHIVGSPAYMAPEQAQGRNIDARADLYALGVTLFEMVCGRPPFEGAAWDVLGQHVHASAPDPRAIEPSLPDRLAELILCLLQKSPDDRPDSAQEVASRLRGILGGSGASVEVAEPLPYVLQAASSRPYVGRGAALEALRHSWQQAQSGRPVMSLIVGEPGIGKTRLAALLAEDVQHAGGLVVYGRCDEDALVSYQPFVEALRELVGSCPGLERRIDPRLQSELTELARLVPELRGGASDIDAPARGNPERYVLFESVMALFTEAAHGRPLLLVLDDLHWADKPTMQLLRHALHVSAGNTMMVLGTTRPEGLDPVHPLMAGLAHLRRGEPGRLQRVMLQGLDEAETGALVGASGPAVADPELAHFLHKLTAGNPFFIEETLRALQDLPTNASVEAALGSLGVPAGAEEVIQRRLTRLAPETVELLTLASLSGVEFQLDVLAVLKAMPADEVLRWLEEAVSAGLVVEAAVDHFAFCHALVRDALYARLGTRSKRARLHLALGEALEKLGDHRVSAAELAHHFHAALHVGGAERCTRYSRAAAADAANALAYEEAAEYEAKALDGLEELDSSRAEDTLVILHSIGRLRWKAGDGDGAQAAFLREAELARELGDAEHLARAALGFASRSYDAEQLDPVLIRLLEEALAKLPPGHSAVRARVMAALADALQFADAPERVLQLSGEACSLARRTGDRDALISVLAARHDALLHIEHLPERIGVSNEWLELAERQEHQDNLALALNWSIYDRFELGDSEAAQALHDRLKQLAESLKQPLYQAFDATWDFNWLEIAGRFEEAEARAAECFRFARRAHATFAPTLYGAQLYGLRRDQGRLDEFAQAVVPLVGPEPRLTGWRALLLTVRASRGECDAIHPELRNLTQEGALAKDGFWLATVCLLAESCTQIADRDLAATLLAQLEPYADRYAQVGLAISLGPVYRFIGLLAAQLGDEQRAESHFGAALERCLKFGARTHGTVVRCDLGELLSKRSAARERENGRELLQQARDDAQTLGMSGILARAEAAIG